MEVLDGPPALDVTESSPPSKPKREKKPRSEAQMASFKAAVEKLRAKRDAERSEKAQRKAEEVALKAEAKAAELKAKVPAAAPAPPAPAPPPDWLSHVEKMLDSKLAFLTPTAEAAVKAPRRRAKVVDSGSDSDSAHEHVKKQRPPHAPAPRHSVAPSVPPALPLWYDSLFRR